MEQRPTWKDKVMGFFFEPEEEAVRDSHALSLDLSGWQFWLVLIGLSVLLGMTAFSYMYTYKMSQTVEDLCAVPLQQIGSYTAKGGVFEMNTTKGPVFVLLEPMQTDSTTHRHLKCTVTGL